MEKAHVVLIPLPAQGHFNAFMKLGKGLASEGAVVTVVNVDSIHATVLQRRKPLPGLDIRFLSIPFEWHVPFGMDASAHIDVIPFFRSLQALSDPLFLLLQPIQPQITLILSDFFMPFTRPVALKLGADWALFFSGSASWASLEYHAPLLHSNGHLLNPAEGKTQYADGLIDYVGGLPPFEQADLPWSIRFPNELWFQLTMSGRALFRDASWVLVNSFYQLEPEAFDYMRTELGHKFLPVGPVHLLETAQTGISLRTEDQDCIPWLDSQPEKSVLYISFGSLVTISSTNLEEIAAGLEGNKQRFIWVIRSDLIEEGYEEMFNRLCERLKALGKVVCWAPQAEVLAHPSVGGFLSHCGWNSTLESICSGIPLLTWPGAAEQNFNAKVLADDWKVGFRIVHKLQEVVEKGKVEESIRKLMNENEGHEMRLNALKLQRLSKDAMRDQQCNLQIFVQHLTSNTHHEEQNSLM